MYGRKNLNNFNKLFSLTRFGKLIAVVIIFCVISILFISRINQPKIGRFDYLTVEQKLFYDILNPICEDIPSTDIVNINHIFDPEPELFTDRSDLNHLMQFCSPYVYSRIYLGIGDSEGLDCAEESKERGKNCKWYHMCVWPADKDKYVSKAIINGGVWEPELIEVAFKHLSSKPKGLVLDIGANIGEYTVLAAVLGHTVFAYEPIPDHLKMLHLTAKLNGFQNRVHFFRNGVSDYVSAVNININKDNKGGSTIDKIFSSEDETKADHRFDTRFKIELIRLDDTIPYIEEYCPDMDIVFWKADIEGYEPRMFRGAYKLFSDKKPPFIVFELLGKSFNRTHCGFKSLLPALRNLGYKIMDLDGKEWSPDKLDDFLTSNTPFNLNKLSIDIRLELIDQKSNNTQSTLQSNVKKS